MSLLFAINYDIAQLASRIDTNVTNSPPYTVLYYETCMNVSEEFKMTVFLFPFSFFFSFETIEDAPAPHLG